jgi:hypothetical protein
MIANLIYSARRLNCAEFQIYHGVLSVVGHLSRHLSHFDINLMHRILQG